MALKSTSKLWRLQDKLKQEHLFVSEEKNSIESLNSCIQATSEKLFHLSWKTRQHWKNLDRLLTGRRISSVECSWTAKIIDSAKFVDGYRYLGYQESKYGDFLRELRSNTRLVAMVLHCAENHNMDTSSIVRFFLCSLYSTCLLPEDVQYALMVMENLIEFQILSNKRMKDFFRSFKSSFIYVFKVFTEGLFSAKLYLTAALHEPILQVLADDVEYLDLDSQICLSRFTPGELKNRFGEPGSQASEKIQEYMDELEQKLIKYCNTFMKNLHQSTYCFPKSLRIVLCKLYNMVLATGQLTIEEVRSMVSDLLMSYFICPAILNPEPYGIYSDMQISEIARYNLSQIATVLQYLALKDTQTSDSRLIEVSCQIQQDSLSLLLDALLEEAEDLSEFASQYNDDLPGLGRNAVLLTQTELCALISFLEWLSKQDDQILDKSSLNKVLAFLPTRNAKHKAFNLPKDDAMIPSVQQPSPSASPATKTKISIKKRKKSNPGIQENAVNIGLPAARVALLDTKQEIVKQFSAMPQDGEELMVIMLGMSTVECPGMLPEEKVLGKRIIPRRNTLSPPPKDARPTSLRTHAVPQRNSHSSDNGDNDDSTDEDDIAIELEKSATTQELSESLKASDSSQLTNELPELPQEPGLLQPSSNTQNIDFQLISHTDSFGPDVTPFQPHSTSLIQTPPLDISLQKEGGDQFQLISETGDSLSPGLGMLQARSTSPVIQAQPLNFIESPVYERNTSPCPFSLDQNSSATLSPCPFSPVKDAPPSPLLSGSSTSTAPLGTLIDFADSSEEFTSGSFSPTMNAFSHLVGSPPFPTDVKRDSRDSAFSSYSILSEPNSRDSIGSISSGITADSVGSSVTLLANRGSLSSSGSSASELRGNQVSSSGGSAGEGKQKNKPLEDIEENKKGDSLKMNSKGGPIISKIGISRRKASSYKLKSPTKDNEQEKQKPRSTLGSKILNMKWGRKEERRTRKKDGVQVYNMLTDDVLETFMAVIPHDQAPEKTAKEISDGIIQKYKMMGRRSAPEPAQAKSDTDALQSTADIMYTLEDAKCRLRQVLCCADFHNLSWMTASARTPTPHNQEETGQTELMTFLQSQFAETINLHDRSLAVKLQETIRCIKQIPPDSYSKVIRMLEDDYKARAPYISYLIRSRQGLLLTQAHLDKLTERVERDIFICRKYFTSVCVRLFLEQRESKIVDLCRRFQDLTISDEKATIIRDFLDELLNDIASDPIWRDSSEDQRYELEVATERVIFNKIYKNALYPLGDSDRLRDQMYYTHTALLAKAVGVRHKALDIPEIYCKEAPWPSAQTELLAINAYKTPTDKLKCIQRCCTTIMNLLSMANELSVPGADDFVPVLVFVVIQANPPNLLSTIEYVNNFYGERLSGEESYCWMQFCAATQFVKSMLMKFGTG